MITGLFKPQCTTSLVGLSTEQACSKRDKNSKNHSSAKPLCSPQDPTANGIDTSPGGNTIVLVGDPCNLGLIRTGHIRHRLSPLPLKKDPTCPTISKRSLIKWKNVIGQNTGLITKKYVALDLSVLI